MIGIKVTTGITKTQPTLETTGNLKGWNAAFKHHAWLLDRLYAHIDHQSTIFLVSI
jgi:hypothetical protein